MTLPSAAKVAAILWIPLLAAAQGSPPAPASPAERCANCHAALAMRPVQHPAAEDCTSCHQAVPGEPGKCKSRAAARWKLTGTEPDLCYGCHDRLDKAKVVHSAVSGGMCLSCHDPHGSSQAHLLVSPPARLCLPCHEAADVRGKRPFAHAPAVEGACLGCHSPHGSAEKAMLRAAPGSSKLCLGCHDAKAPAGKGTPSAAFRVDLSRKTVHAAVSGGDCGDCHEAGHAGDLPRLLRKPPAETCRGCHDGVGKEKYPHSAVAVGDCVVCHDPHSSDAPRLLARASMAETCFVCHQDDLTGRKVVHAPVEGGCDGCHAPHGGANRFGLRGGEGKAVCYGCHEVMDQKKNRHAALERYGCTVCHDPHGTANAFLTGKPVNELCASCHPAQLDGRHVTSILATGHVLSGPKDPKRPDRGLTCASCHDPHGSEGPSLLRHGESQMQSCDWCHGDKSGRHPELKDVVSEARRAPPSSAGAPARTGAGAGEAPGGRR
ncbi:MAG TPA: cytochrome c3 family protein [Anaeromyxobacteraceae bacterium]|nr:cytochrome c3 family protein [Anaeromyxobacteraceae bacterium]